MTIGINADYQEEPKVQLCNNTKTQNLQIINKKLDIQYEHSKHSHKDPCTYSTKKGVGGLLNDRASGVVMVLCLRFLSL